MRKFKETQNCWIFSVSIKHWMDDILKPCSMLPAPVLFNVIKIFTKIRLLGKNKIKITHQSSLFLENLFTMFYHVILACTINTLLRNHFIPNGNWLWTVPKILFPSNEQKKEIEHCLMIRFLCLHVNGLVFSLLVLLNWTSVYFLDH